MYGLVDSCRVVDEYGKPFLEMKPPFKVSAFAELKRKNRLALSAMFPMNVEFSMVIMPSFWR